MLAKYFNAQGLKPVEIRKEIFKWANENGIFIKHNVNDIIKMVISEGQSLTEHNVYVSNEDIKTITDCFDGKNIQLCAFALLLYAKSYADENGEFSFSQLDFSRWVGIQQPHVCEYFNELEMFDYIERIYPEDKFFVWNGRVNSKNIIYKIKVKYDKSGEHFIDDNNVRLWYQILFSKKR